MNLLSSRFRAPVVERLPGRRIRVLRETGGTWTELRVERLDVVMLAVTVGLFAWSVAGLADPAWQFVAVIPSYDLVFDTLGLLATLAVAGLAWLHYRDNRESFNLFEASAFLVLAIPNAMHLAVLMTDPDVAAGMSLLDQGQAPLYAFPVAGITAAVLLVFGAVVYRGGRRPRFAAAVILVPAVVVLAELLAVELGHNLAPVLATTATGGGPAGSRPVPTPLATILGGVAAAMFLVAAVLSRRSIRPTGNVGRAYLTVGLTFAAFAMFDGILDPSYAGLVSGSDVLRLSFYVVLLVGLTVETHATLRALAGANESLARLKTAEVDRAALEERARLSRELHDGLAQELWLAKLKAGRLARCTSAGSEATALTGELVTAIDTGLADARQAVQALRVGAGDDATSPSASLMRRYVDDFGDRFGLRAEFECDARTCRALAPAPKRRCCASPRRRSATCGGTPTRRSSGSGSQRHEGSLRADRARQRQGVRPAAVGGQDVRPVGHARAGGPHRAAGSRSSRVPWTARRSTSRSRCRGAPPSGRAIRVSAHRRDGAGARHARRRPRARAGRRSPGDHRAGHRDRRRGRDGRGGAPGGPEVRPDVLLVDIDLPGMDGVRLVRELAPAPAGDADRDADGVVRPNAICVEAIRYGRQRLPHQGPGAGGAPARRPRRASRRARDAAAHGGVASSAASSTGPRSRPRRATDDPELPTLSAREHEVLRLLADGLTDREIAAALTISPRTVETHVSSILHKLRGTEPLGGRAPLPRRGPEGLGAWLRRGRPPGPSRSRRGGGVAIPRPG